MSKENVDVVRGLFEDWNAGDMDAVRDRYDPDVIFRTPEGWPEQGPFTGRDAVMREFHQLRGTFADETMDVITDFLHVADRVVVRFIWRGVGHGPSSNIELTAVFSMRRARIFGHDLFWSHVEALEAAGLAE